MSYSGSVKIVNKAGWSKTVVVEKSLCTIGSSRTSDVSLPGEYGSGVLPLHLQLICPKNGAGTYRLINLSDSEIQVFDKALIAKGALSPRTAFVIRDGDVLQLGDFSLHFLLLSRNGVSIERRTTNIGVKLELPGLQLNNGKSLSGVLTLTNYGETRRSQFSIEMDGLPRDCFQISPAPLLYPGAAEELPVRFFHRGTRPGAGLLPIAITVSASASYPTEVITLPVELEVEANHQFSIAVLDQKKSIPEHISSPADEGQRGEHSLSIVEAPETNTSEPIFSGAAAPSAVRNAAETLDNPQETYSAASMPEKAEPAYADLEPSKAFERGEAVFAAEKREMVIVQEDDASWSSSRPDRLNNWRRDIKSRLAAKEIQVIRAGDENDEDSGQSS